MLPAGGGIIPRLDGPLLLKLQSAVLCGVPTKGALLRSPTAGHAFGAIPLLLLLGFRSPFLLPLGRIPICARTANHVTVPCESEATARVYPDAREADLQLGGRVTAGGRHIAHHGAKSMPESAANLDEAADIRAPNCQSRDSSPPHPARAVKERATTPPEKVTKSPENCEVRAPIRAGIDLFWAVAPVAPRVCMGRLGWLTAFSKPHTFNHPS